MHLSEGFDFLAFSIRRYPNGKLLTKPGKDALRQIRRRLSAEMRALRGANADAVVARINPNITGSPGRVAADLRGFRAEEVSFDGLDLLLEVFLLQPVGQSQLRTW